MDDDIDYSLLKQNTIKKYWDESGIYKQESIQYIKKCKRYNRSNYEVKSILVLTTHALYIFEEKSNLLKVRISFHEIKAIAQSTYSKQFVLKFDLKDDERLHMEDREEILNFILMRFPSFCPDLNLNVYDIPEKDLQLYEIRDKAVITAQMIKTKPSKPRNIFSGYFGFGLFDDDKDDNIKLWPEEKY